MINLLLFLVNPLEGFRHVYCLVYSISRSKYFYRVLQHSRLVSVSTCDNLASAEQRVIRRLRIPNSVKQIKPATSDLFPEARHFSLSRCAAIPTASRYMFLRHSEQIAMSCFKSISTPIHHYPFHFTVHNYSNSSLNAQQ
jgi:hypothetical protein